MLIFPMIAQKHDVACACGMMIQLDKGGDVCVWAVGVVAAVAVVVILREAYVMVRRAAWYAVDVLAGHVGWRLGVRGREK